MKVILDNKIPFISSRLEPVADVIYADPFKFTPELVADADALIVRTRTKCDSRLLQDSNVRLISTATIGMDHIDLKWCEENGIEVRNAAGCNAPGVAQYVWASLMRLGFDTKKDTLGIIGKGHIGSIVADWGRKAGVKILVCDPPRERAGMTDENYVSLEELLAASDAVTIHTPLNRGGVDNTFHLIGDKEMKSMKKGAVLVNAARGAVVDNAAWADAISVGEIRGVIDVWEGEPEINKRLLALAEIATPHIAGYSLQGKERATRMALESIEEKFGYPLNKSGLEGDYIPPATVGDLRNVVESYNPFADTKALRDNPSGFESLRSNYIYRSEPVFS
ncbi:MAG: 4-phosphoerythronate dehydrogenase [Muribaculaceae bacterium]|nr:4-phosphoerythronate dehydrogenase [Muribaculaceae bacterium]